VIIDSVKLVTQCQCLCCLHVTSGSGVLLSRGIDADVDYYITRCPTKRFAVLVTNSELESWLVIWFLISDEHVYLPTRQKDRPRQIIYSGIKHIVNSNYTVTVLKGLPNTFDSITFR